jgi:hypothetical protein
MKQIKNINQIIKKSNCFIEQPFQNLIDYIKNIYLIENDYHLLFQHFKEIIAFENKDFENHIIYKNEEIINKVSLLLNQFNKTLFSQIYLNDNYHIYNLKETYFKLMYLYYFSLINDTFKKYKRKINIKNSLIIIQKNLILFYLIIILLLVKILVI